MKLMNNLDLRNLTFSKHDESEFDERQLEVLYDAINKGIDISNYADEGYGGLVLMHVLRAVANGYDARYLLNNDFSAKQLYLISDGLRLGLDVSQYADPSIPFTEMRMIKSKLFNDKLRGDANEVDK